MDCPGDKCTAATVAVASEQDTLVGCVEVVHDHSFKLGCQAKSRHADRYQLPKVFVYTKIETV